MKATGYNTTQSDIERSARESIWALVVGGVGLAAVWLSYKALPDRVLVGGGDYFTNAPGLISYVPFVMGCFAWFIAGMLTFQALATWVQSTGPKKVDRALASAAVSLVVLVLEAAFYWYTLYWLTSFPILGRR